MSNPERRPSQRATSPTRPYYMRRLPNDIRMIPALGQIQYALAPGPPELNLKTVLRYERQPILMLWRFEHLRFDAVSILLVRAKGRVAGNSMIC